MIDAFFAWLPGDDILDWAAIIGTAFLVLVFVVLPLWALVDHLRPSKGEHFRPVGEAASAVSEPAEPVAVKSGRSPFAPPKQREGAK